MANKGGGGGGARLLAHVEGPHSGLFCPAVNSKVSKFLKFEKLEFQPSLDRVVVPRYDEFGQFVDVTPEGRAKAWLRQERRP